MIIITTINHVIKMCTVTFLSDGNTSDDKTHGTESVFCYFCFILFKCV